MQAHTQGVSLQAHAARQRSSSFTRRVNWNYNSFKSLKSCFSSCIINMTTVLTDGKWCCHKCCFFPRCWSFNNFLLTFNISFYIGTVKKDMRQIFLKLTIFVDYFTTICICQNISNFIVKYSSKLLQRQMIWCYYM